MDGFGPARAKPLASGIRMRSLLPRRMNAGGEH